jgi:cytochrome c peroxidase
MNDTLTNVISKLAATEDYAAGFAGAFGSREIDSDRMARALEQFLLTQTSHDSKFDRCLRGEAVLTEPEQRGFELFHTEYDPRRGQLGADCFHCHGGPLFQSQAFANNGLDTSFVDVGRSAVTGQAGDLGKFAVPSLRNVELTAPYMHDGRIATLEEVVEHYSTRIQRSATLDPNLAKHPAGGVPLAAADKQALVAFLRTLTDERLREWLAGFGPRAVD